MANNANINKVIYGNDTLIDLTGDSITPSDVLNSKSFHDASGTLRTGTADISGKADLTDLADAFSDEQAYSTGDYVTYDGDLYRFTSNKSAGAWDSTKVTQITVADELSVLPSKADKIQLAPEFSTSSSYNAGQYCIFNGRLYRFDSNKSAGDWSYSKVTEVTVSSELRQKENWTSFSTTDFFVIDLDVEHQLPQHNVSLMRANSVAEGGSGVVSAQQVLSAITTASSTLNTKIIQRALATSLAPAFSSSTAYKKGDYVTYSMEIDGTKSLYRFTEDHPAGYFTGFDVEVVAVMDEVSDLQDSVKANTQLISESIWGESGKNLLPSNAVSDTVDGIEYTVDSNGVINADGTSTALSILTINDFLINTTSLKAGETYRWSGCAGGSDSTYNLYIVCRDSSNTQLLVQAQYGDDYLLTIPQNTARIQMYARVMSGQTVSNVKYYPMIREVDVLDSTYEPYHDAIEDNVTANTTLISESIWGEHGKNLIENTAVSGSNNGVDYTVNIDKSVSCANTATGLSWFRIWRGKLKNGTYIVTGCPTGGLKNGAGYRLGFWNETPTAGSLVNARDTGYGVTVTITDETQDYAIYVGCGSGVNMDGKKFYPMLRDASILDPTYEPYHSSVKDTLRDAEVIEGKNKLNNFLVSATDRTVTATTNSDKSVTVNGTPTSGTTAWFKIAEFPAGSLPAGRYILSGCPSGGSNQTYKLMIREDPQASWQRDDYGSGNEFDLTDTTKKYVSYIGVYGTASNLLFKPMLRLASETDPTYETYYEPLKDIVFPRSEQKILGSSNMAKQPTIASNTVSGVTFVNTNGVVVANNQATADANFGWDIGHLPIGRYKFVGCPADGSATKYCLRLGIGDTASDWGTYVNADYGSGFVFDVTNESKYYSICCRVFNGYNASNVTFKPMITPNLDATYSDYVTYASTNRMLTENSYSTSDTAETTIADADYFPFYDTSATGKRKTLWSTIKSVLKTYFDSLYNKYLENSSVVLSTSTTTDVTFTDASITANSVIDFACTVYDLVPDNMTATTGSCTVTLPKVDSAMTVGVRLYIRS